MSSTKTPTFPIALIWFGAALSIAEILTGTLLAPLGFVKGFAAIVLGHIIGGFLLYLAGVIGAKTQKSSMETVKTAFGKKGSVLFSLLNVVQLVGWTAVMIAVGMTTANALLPLGDWVWGLIIAGLVICWVFIGIKNFNKVNVVAMGLLFSLTLVLSVTIFQGNVPYTGQSSMPFGVAVELSAVMPLSWLPLIADYMRTAQKPLQATRTSAAVYLLGSTWMYTIGLGAALYTAQTDMGQILLHSGLGVLGAVVVLFSTTAGTFLDAYSGGVSAVSIWKNLNEKSVGICVCLAGLGLALFTPIREYESFLLFIGSVFAPMAAVLITNFFLLQQDYHTKDFAILNLAVWFMGFIFYHILKAFDLAIGTTLPVIAVTMVLCYVVNKFLYRKNAVA